MIITNKEIFMEAKVIALWDNVRDRVKESLLKGDYYCNYESLFRIVMSHL